MKHLDKALLLCCLLIYCLTRLFLSFVFLFSGRNRFASEHKLYCPVAFMLLFVGYHAAAPDGCIPACAKLHFAACETTVMIKEAI